MTGNQSDYADNCISSLKDIKDNIHKRHPIIRYINTAIEVFERYKKNQPPLPDKNETRRSPPKK